MAFPETVTKEIKRRAHFQCCLCKAVGIEIHHIIPQAESGPDTLDNGAPLCPSCHETYGANPTKRKLIRDARDLWYEICAARYAPDFSVLQSVRDAVENTASKKDVSELSAGIASILQQLKLPGGTLTVRIPRHSAHNGAQVLDASDLMVLVYGNSSDRPKEQVELLCIQEFWPLKGGYRSICKDFVGNFGSFALRRLASRALDSLGIPPVAAMTEDEISEALNLMIVEAVCMNFLAKGEFVATLTASGEIEWADVSCGPP